MKKLRSFLLSILFLVSVLNIGLAQEFSKAGPGSIIATVDANCNPRITQFSVGQGFLAVQFSMVSFNGGTDCTLGRPVDEKGFTIQSQNGTEIYKWFQYQDNPPLQPLGLFDVLSLSSGTYTLQVTGGRDAQVILRFQIINVDQQTLPSTLSDSDKDGVPDQWDKCPNTPSNSYVDSTGCPGQSQTIDTDKDGVIDQWDVEPNTPPNSYVDKNGRQGQTQINDADKDGVIDQWDTEPNTPPNSYVDRNGRKGQTQLNDSDGDGVIDIWDTEPNTPPNSLVDRNGRATAVSTVQSQPSPQQQNLSDSAPWEIWLGRWEVVSSYSNCPAASTLAWWFEVSRQGKGYAVVVQSGQKTKIDTLSDQNLEFKIADEIKTEIKLWMTSDGQCEGTVFHPRNVAECQHGQVVAKKR